MHDGLNEILVRASDDSGNVSAVSVIEVTVVDLRLDSVSPGGQGVAEDVKQDPNALVVFSQGGADDNDTSLDAQLLMHLPSVIVGTLTLSTNDPASTSVIWPGSGRWRYRRAAIFLCQTVRLLHRSTWFGTPTYRY